MPPRQIFPKTAVMDHDAYLAELRQARRGNEEHMRSLAQQHAEQLSGSSSRAIDTEQDGHSQADTPSPPRHAHSTHWHEHHADVSPELLARQERLAQHYRDFHAVDACECETRVVWDGDDGLDVTQYGPEQPGHTAVPTCQLDGSPHSVASIESMWSDFAVEDYAPAPPRRATPVPCRDTWQWNVTIPQPFTLSASSGLTRSERMMLV